MPKFRESVHAHRWLDPLAESGVGLEVGQSAHNRYNIANCLNLDYTDEDTIYKQEERRICGEVSKVDIVAFADEIPFPDSYFSYLLNSHVFEHQCNPLKTLLEWHRVVKNDGIIYSVIPHRDALDTDKQLPLTSIAHQVVDYVNHANYETHEIPPGSGKNGHYHIYNCESYIRLIDEFNSIFGYKLEIIESLHDDDKVGNGHVFVHKVIK